MDERGTNFALLAIVAIVAIVALVVLLKAQGQKAMPMMESKNVAGQMMKIGGAGSCSLDQDGECSGTCAQGGKCKDIDSQCKCG